jgi:hypothetical protein
MVSQHGQHAARSPAIQTSAGADRPTETGICQYSNGMPDKTMRARPRGTAAI